MALLGRLSAAAVQDERNSSQEPIKAQSDGPKIHINQSLHRLAKEGLWLCLSPMTSDKKVAEDLDAATLKILAPSAAVLAQPDP